MSAANSHRIPPCILSRIHPYYPTCTSTTPHLPLLPHIHFYCPTCTPTTPHPPLLPHIHPYCPASTSTAPHPLLLPHVHPYYPTSTSTAPHPPLLPHIHLYCPTSTYTAPVSLPTAMQCVFLWMRSKRSGCPPSKDSNNCRAWPGTSHSTGTCLGALLSSLGVPLSSLF